MAINISKGGAGSGTTITNPEDRSLKTATRVRDNQLNLTDSATTAQTGSRVVTDTGAKTNLGKAIVDRIKTSGGVTTNVNQEVATGNPLINEQAVTGDAVIDSQNIASEDTSVEDTLAAAIDEYIAGLTASNQSAFDANVSNIQAEETIAVQGQEELKRQAEQDYLSKLDEINKGVFDTTQRAKVSSEARGIGSSQQAEGLQQGIAREGLGLRFKNDQDRSVRINNIVDRIAAIQTSTAQRITGAGQEQNAANLAAQAEGGRLGLERGFELEDQASAREFSTSEREAIQEFTLGRDATAFENQMLAAAQQNEWNVDAAYLAATNAMSRLGVSAANALQLEGMRQSGQMNIARYNAANQKEIAAMSQADRIQLAELGYENQLDLLDRKDELTNEQWQRQIKYETVLSGIADFSPGGDEEQAIIDAVYEKNPTPSFLKKVWTYVLGTPSLRNAAAVKNVDANNAKEIQQALENNKQFFKDQLFEFSDVERP